MTAPKVTLSEKDLDTLPFIYVNGTHTALPIEDLDALIQQARAALTLAARVTELEKENADMAQEIHDAYEMGNWS